MPRCNWPKSILLSSFETLVRCNFKDKMPNDFYGDACNGLPLGSHSGKKVSSFISGSCDSLKMETPWSSDP